MSTPESRVDLVLENCTVLTMNDDRDSWRTGYVAVRDDRIVEVGSQADAPLSAHRRLDMSGHVVMPGLVNCHAHHGLTLSRGLFDEMPLAQWMDVGLWPSIRGFTEERCYLAARVALAELVLGGVTTSTSSDWSNVHTRGIDGVLRAVTESGMRAIVSRIAHDSSISTPASQVVPVDMREPIKLVLDDVDRLRSSWNSSRVEVAIEPLGVLRCSTEMMRDFGRYATDNGMRFLMHVASSKGERDGALERFGRTPVEELARLDLLGPNALLAHCVWLSSTDIELLRDSATGVSHNPVANLYYATGISPMSELLEQGVRVGLGVDTAATNNSQNLWETMKFALLVQKERLSDATFGSAEQILVSATRGGAEALGLIDEIGTLEVGKKADIISIDTRRPHLTPDTCLLSNLVYSGNPNAVQTVIVDGQILVQDGQLQSWDVQDVVGTANRAAQELFEDMDVGSIVAERSSFTWH